MKKEKIVEEKTVEAQEANPAEDAKTAKITKVGAMLKSMRLQKGLKIVDISKKLCIRKCYLEAIEDSNYKELPAVPYGIGFIRSYANYMGLNGENIVELYKEETNSTPADEMKVLEAQPEATVPSFQYLLISLLAIIAIYVAWIFFVDNKNQTEIDVEEKAQAVENVADENNSGVVVIEDFVPAPANETADENAKPEDDQVVVSEAQYVEPEKKEVKTENTENANQKQEVKAEEVAETTPEEKKEETKLEIPSTGVFLEVLKETWVEVKDQNKLYLSKVLQAGEGYKVPAGSGMILSVGKYDGVNVYIDGTLTKVVRATKKMNIALDQYLNTKN